MTTYALLPADGRPTLVTVEDYRDIQTHVGGLFCAPWEGSALEGIASIFANDEGILLGMDYNLTASMLTKQHLVGPVLIGGPVDDEGNVTDVTDVMKAILLRWTGCPL